MTNNHSHQTNLTSVITLKKRYFYILWCLALIVNSIYLGRKSQWGIIYIGLDRGNCLIKLIYVRGHKPLSAAPFPRQGTLNCMSKEMEPRKTISQVSMCTSVSLALSCACDVTSCVKLLSQWLPCYYGLQPGIVSQINLFFPQFLLIRVFYQSNKKETTTHPHFNSLSCRDGQCPGVTLLLFPCLLFLPLYSSYLTMYH